MINFDFMQPKLTVYVIGRENDLIEYFTHLPSTQKIYYLKRIVYLLMPKTEVGE